MRDLKKQLIILFSLPVMLFGAEQKEVKPETTTYVTRAVLQKPKLLEIYKNTLPKWMKVDLKYKYNLPKYLEYIYIKSVDGNIREKPSTQSAIVEKLPYNTKLRLVEKMENNYGSVWYKVKTPSGKTGYISERLVNERVFRFDIMMGKIKELEEFVANERANGRSIYTTNSYVPNPNNVNFKRQKDKYGVSLDQNILGYHGNEAIVVPDKSILSLESDNGQKAVVNVASIKDGPLTIDSKYLAKGKAINENFRKVIAIDIENQNLGVFEKINGHWTLISYVYTKTGTESEVGFETPRGFFLVPVLKYEMGYRSEIGENQGYAKYAIRFSGGGYLHGTPLNYEEDSNREYYKALKETTLGTVPGTRKCVRTSEEHARFLFNWILNGKTNPSNNEQYPSENVMMIIF
jgi:hypothetical protein